MVPTQRRHDACVTSHLWPLTHVRGPGGGSRRAPPTAVVSGERVACVLRARLGEGVCLAGDAGTGQLLHPTVFRGLLDYPIGVGSPRLVRASFSSTFECVALETKMFSNRPPIL